MVRRKPQKNSSLNQELKTLIMHGRNDEVLAIVKNCTLSSLINNEGMTLLHLAIKYDNLGLIESLLQFGYDIDAKNSSNLTPLMTAVTYRRFEAVKLLLDADADVYVSDVECEILLRSLLDRKNPVPGDLIELFLIKLKSRNLDCETMSDILLKANCPLDLVYLHINNTEVLRLILDRNVYMAKNECRKFLNLLVDSTDLENLRAFANRGGYICLHKRTHAFILKFSRMIDSCENANFEPVRPFVEDFVNWDVSENLLIRFLRKIFGEGSREVVRLFLDCQVADHVKQSTGEDLIARIFGNTNEGVIEVLENREFNVNGRDALGFRALHFAAAEGLEDNVKYLLKRNADPNATNNRGRTPLICYQAWTNVRIAERLIRAGADMQIEDNNGSTIIDVFAHSMLLDTVVARIAILQAKDVAIKPFIRDQIDTIHRLRRFYEQCLRQLEEMKDYEISKSDTLFSVLTKDVERLDVRNERKSRLVDKFYEDKGFEDTYGLMLTRKIEEAFKVYELRKKAAIFVAECIGVLIDPCHLVMEKIIGYLSYDDLIVFA